MSTEKKERLWQLMRFCITGGVASCIQYGSYELFLIWCKLTLELSVVLSYGLSFSVNYVLSNFFTFRTRPNRYKALRFILAHLINLTLQMVFVNLFARFMSEQWAILPAMAICIPINFLMVRWALK